MSKSRSLLKDSLISIPISIIYIYFVHRIIELLTENSMAEAKTKKHIIYSFIIGICGILIGIYIFGRSKIANRPVKFALVLSSFLLMIYSLYSNWELLQSDTKLIIVGIFLVAVISASYLA
jgi:hypothetical protein